MTKVGNRKTKTENGFTTTYQYDDNNRLIQEDDIIYSYDDNGNLKEKTSVEETVTYFYDAENNLTRVETTRFGVTIVVEYEYDAEGNRVRKTIDGNVVINYLVDTNRDYAQVLEERDENGALLVRYVYGHDLISQTRSGATTYYHYDGLGSTRVLTSSAEVVTDTYNYDAFGNLLDKTGTTTNDYLYTGEFFDMNVGFYYLRARYMDPAVGRFVTMDSFTGLSHDPISLHKYLYASANPITYSDPSGYIALMTETTKTAIRNMFERMRIPIIRQALAVFHKAKVLARVLQFTYKGVQIDPVRILLRYLFWRALFEFLEYFTGADDGGGDNRYVTLYHGTSSNKASKIVKRGFRQNVDPYTYFAQDPEVATVFGMDQNPQARSWTLIIIKIPMNIFIDEFVKEGLIMSGPIGSFNDAPFVDVGDGMETVLREEGLGLFNKYLLDGTFKVSRKKL